MLLAFGNFPTDGIEWNSVSGGELLLTSMFPNVPAASVVSDINNDPAKVGLPAGCCSIGVHLTRLK
jgi:hypothetical protein